MRHRIRSRRRGPKQPLPDSSDSTYYAAIDPDNDIYGSRFTDSRCYIDPWDLENYDYVRRQLGSGGASSTPSPAGEPISSTFFYLPNNIEECPACYAGLDEQTFYNAKYETILDEDRAYSTYTDFESLSLSDKNSSGSESSVSTLMLHTPGFGPAASGRRRMVLPKPAPRLEFPAPPPYDFLPMHESNYYSVSDCMSEHIPVYSPTSTYGGGSSIYSYLNRFGLSKKGLLQIDYSCNWNDLDRYIATKDI